jgi:acetyl-CoA decarbonylase/synthase complex subunit gamma
MAEKCGCESTETSSCCEPEEIPLHEPTQAVACCGGSSAERPFTYGSQPFEIGVVETAAGPVPQVSRTLTRADHSGGRRVRWNIGRSRYRVKPGLYALGEPGKESPVLVTANYKLTFDHVRSTIDRDAWILVLDTRGINVWCAAGKGTFGTMELISQTIAAGLDLVVTHNTLIVPQLGATGVAARHVQSTTGFGVVWGPVDIADLGTFLDAGNTATEAMRRVEFPVADRAVLIPVELSIVWSKWVVLGVAGLLLVIAFAIAAGATSLTEALVATAAALAIGVVSGTVLVPLLLPWIPGRAFALKGALTGLALGAVLALLWPQAGALLGVGMIALSSAISSFTAMNFTGSSTYTSPSGVEWEMRRSIPLQAAGAVTWFVATVAWLVVA